MKPSLQFSIPCLGYQEEGPPTFQHIFYELPFPSFPYAFPDPGFFVANGWCCGTGQHEQRMQILHPEKKAVLIDTGAQPFNLEEPETPFMAVNLFQKIEFPAPGTYWFRIFLDGEVALEYPLVVRQSETTEVGAPDQLPPGAPSGGAPRNLQIS